MELKIYLFRHGQTEFNRNSKFTGLIDSRLTKTGTEDAKIVSQRLKNKKIDLSFCTSLSRSKETLKEVLKNHPECEEIIEDDRMIERIYGNLQGKTHWEVVKKYGPEKYDKWHRSFYSRPPRGESFADVEKRVSSFIKDLITLAKKKKANIAISAHGNSIRLFRKIMEKASEKQACEWFIPYDSVFTYSVKV